jgi:hypothetical protein
VLLEYDAHDGTFDFYYFSFTGDGPRFQYIPSALEDFPDLNIWINDDENARAFQEQPHIPGTDISLMPILPIENLIGEIYSSLRAGIPD